MAHAKTLTVADGTALHVVDHPGEGTPVVLLHGWPLDHTSWKPQIDALTAAGHRVVTYDRRGFGKSNHAHAGFDYETFAADLNSVLTDLDLNDVVLVGFSMGGGEVVRYMARYGTDRIRSACLVGAVTPFLLITDDNPDGGLRSTDVDGMLTAMRADRPGFFAGFPMMFFGARGELQVTEAEAQEALRVASLASDEAIAQTAHAWATTDFRDDVAALKVPLCIIHGNADGAVPFEVSGQRVHQAIPSATLHIIDSGPHGLATSHKAELATLLVDWAAK